MKKLVVLVLFVTTQISMAQEDPYLWLEEVDGKKALEFVDTQNKNTIEALSSLKDYESIYLKTLEIYNSPERIAYPANRGKFVYNFWQDKEHERGIWRRSPLADYAAGKPKWEVLIDIDKISKIENTKWVFKGATGVYPTYDRFLVSLSNGGGDAVEIREFDVTKKQFVQYGFHIKEAKGGADYVDENTLIVSSDFGEGTMTTSGYPRQVKLWKRGTPLKDAKLIYEGKSTDVGVWGGTMRDGAKNYITINRGMTTFSGETYVYVDDKTVKLDVPDDVTINGILNNQLVLTLKSDWKVSGKTYKNGSLLSLNASELIKGKKVATLIAEPTKTSSIAQVSTTQNKLLVNMLNNVTSELYIYNYNGKWASQKVKAPDFGTINIVATDELSDQYYFEFENFITPSSLYAANAADNSFKLSASLPAYFDAKDYQVQQFTAQSKDGTMVPYFMVSRNNIKKDGNNPTLVYAYGGFEISSQPFYASTFGISWLEHGGVFVLANIRGGGEFGPKWHQDGIKEKRQNVFDDFYAVAENLITNKITTPRHLGIMGGSNGGLLVGVAFTQRPDLYNAVVCEVPLLDMKRYSKLLAGASWMGEYGNPDIPAEWEYIKKYSPYQNLKEKANYPEVFFTTSTRDDRVHPGHARKMVAKMNEMGYKTFYYENTEGGHAGSSTNEQSAKSNALIFSYLLLKLK